LLHSTFNGTPCCRLAETTVPKHSIKPAMVEPLCHADEDFTRLPVRIKTYG
jgi:hypothetical protein